jgi:hypothetical protein
MHTRPLSLTDAQLKQLQQAARTVLRRHASSSCKVSRDVSAANPATKPCSTPSASSWRSTNCRCSCATAQRKEQPTNEQTTSILRSRWQ